MERAVEAAAVKATPAKIIWKRMRSLSTCLRVPRKRCLKNQRSLLLKSNQRLKSKFLKL